MHSSRWWDSNPRPRGRKSGTVSLGHRALTIYIIYNKQIQNTKTYSISLRCDQYRGRRAVDLASRYLRSTAQRRRSFDILFFCGRLTDGHIKASIRSTRQLEIRKHPKYFLSLLLRYSTIADDHRSCRLFRPRAFFLARAVSLTTDYIQSGPQKTVPL